LTKSRMRRIRAMGGGGGPVVVLAPVLEQAIHCLALGFRELQVEVGKLGVGG